MLYLNSARASVRGFRGPYPGLAGCLAQHMGSHLDPSFDLFYSRRQGILIFQIKIWPRPRL